MQREIGENALKNRQTELASLMEGLEKFLGKKMELLQAQHKSLTVIFSGGCTLESLGEWISNEV